uniref:FPG-type domain-containing protein n=1 Tax=Timema genevievae TaxID=629358 RepID=A0A7R9PHK4_TIMGE|nr:unnamed protein product [Timema genevievae]
MAYHIILTPYWIAGDKELKTCESWIVNKSLLVESMHGKTVTAQRHSHDEIQEAGGARNIHIGKKMLDYVRGARKRHHEYLEMKQERSEEDKKKAYKRKLGLDIFYYFPIIFPELIGKTSVLLFFHERLYEDCLVRYNKLCQLDICSSEFDFPSANKLISSRPGKMVCDVIMDQDVLPGALFNSGINPNSTIGELTADLVSRLVHRLRDFSAIFYKCRKENKALSRYMKIYKKERCGECGGRVTVCKPGELKRITYFCASCQTNSVSNLPSTGSLLGFVANSRPDPLP